MPPCKWSILQSGHTIPPTCTAALYSKNNKEIEAQCSLSVFHIPPTFPAIVITSYLWIFISTPTTQESAITVVSPGKATSSSPQQPFHILKLLPACSATSRHFLLPPNYEDNMMTIYISLERAYLNSFNVSAPDFHIWQHIGINWSTTHIKKLANVPEIPITQLYRYWIGWSKPILLFEMNRSLDEGCSLMGKFLTHPGTYIRILGMIFIAGMGIYCLKKLLCRPASPR